MKRALLPVVLLLALAITYFAGNPIRPKLPEKLPPIEVFFSPKGGCTDAVVREIEAATGSILLQAYSFTSKPIAQALVAAHKRGVKVQALLDSDQETTNYSEADFLLHAGISTRIDDKHAIAHNKIIIIDDNVIVTGSFNFTKQAEQSNAENLLVIRDKDLAKIYSDNWIVHSDHSRAYQDKPKQERNYQPERRTKKTT